MTEQPPPKRAPAKDQADVLAQKGGVTQGKLGLQQWTDEATPDGQGAGTAGSGTAARQAKVQAEADEDRH